jgi:hypothetical protein
MWPVWQPLNGAPTEFRVQFDRCYAEKKVYSKRQTTINLFSFENIPSTPRFSAFQDHRRYFFVQLPVPVPVIDAADHRMIIGWIGRWEDVLPA